MRPRIKKIISPNKVKKEFMWGWYRAREERNKGAMLIRGGITSSFLKAVYLLATSYKYSRLNK